MARAVSISILGVAYLKYEFSYLPVVMETLFSKLHEVLHNPIITEVMKRNSNIIERFIFFIIAMFLMQNYLNLTIPAVHKSVQLQVKGEFVHKSVQEFLSKSIIFVKNHQIYGKTKRSV